MSVHNIMYQSLAQNPGYYTDWWTPFATSWLDQKVHPSGHTCTHNIHLCLQALGGLPDSGFPCNWGSGQLVQSLGGLFGYSLLPGEVVAPPFSTAHYYILLVFVPSRDNLEFMETAVPEGSKDKPKSGSAANVNKNKVPAELRKCFLLLLCICLQSFVHE